MNGRQPLTPLCAAVHFSPIFVCFLRENVVCYFLFFSHSLHFANSRVTSTESAHFCCHCLPPTGNMKNYLHKYPRCQLCVVACKVTVAAQNGVSATATASVAAAASVDVVAVRDCTLFSPLAAARPPKCGRGYQMQMHSAFGALRETIIANMIYELIKILITFIGKVNSKWLKNKVFYFLLFFF